MITDSLANAFKTERLLIRAFDTSEPQIKFIYEHIEADLILSALAQPWMLRPQTQKHAEGPGAESENTTAGKIDSSRKDGDEPVPIGILIVGWEGAPQWDQAHHRFTTIGISLAAEYQNQGYGREAVDWAPDCVSRFGAFHSVRIATSCFNERAQSLYLKMGFVEEGRDREAFWVDRKWYDVIRYSMSEHKWEALRG
ncbi:Spermidine N(1)-acetyltransferase [Colletotrichum siamense]|nr:Spermidine N(1)-acetyltransferase [Colletotrichum siamense]